MQLLVAGIKGCYWGQVAGAANWKPSSFKASDYVPSEISHDIPLLVKLGQQQLRYSWQMSPAPVHHITMISQAVAGLDMGAAGQMLSEQMSQWQLIN